MVIRIKAHIITKLSINNKSLKTLTKKEKWGQVKIL